MKYIFRILLFLSTLGPCTCLSQNLVQNGSFENKSACPNINSQITLANNWYNGFAGILSGVCYFNSCASSPNFGVPVNVYGNQAA
ncbi:MAG: hypothetical protein V4651_02175, partial [Bacteroidota bacterium]